jgi:hypothetical protein
MKYTYRFIDPGVIGPPFKKRIRFTRGKYLRTTQPMGPFEFRYAIFVNRSSEVMIPIHDLTDESKAAIALQEVTK